MQSLLVFHRGSSDDLRALIAKLPKPVVVLVLWNKTTDNFFVPALVRELGAQVLDQTRILDDFDRFPYLDDYVATIANWSLNKDPMSGQNLRQALAFDDQVSAWWFLSVNERFLIGEPLELFRAIYVISRWREGLGNGTRSLTAAFLGGSELNAVLGKVFENFGMTLVPRSVQPRSGDSPSVGAGTRWPGLKSLLSLASGRKSEHRVLLISEYPDAWLLNCDRPHDRYMDAVFGGLRRIRPEQPVGLGLYLRLGYKFVASNPIKIADAKKFADGLSQSMPAAQPLVLDQENNVLDFIRARAWVKRKLKTLLPPLEGGAFGKVIYRGVDLTDYFTGLVAKSLREDIARSLAMGLGLSRSLKRHGVKVCVYRNEFYRPGKIISWACHRAGVGSLSIQHGLINPKHAMYHMHASDVQPDPLHQDQINHMPSPARFGVWGEWFRQMLVRDSSYPAAGAPVIGSHRLTWFGSTARNYDYSVLRAKFGFGARDLVFLYTTQDETILEGVEMALEAAAQHPSKPWLCFKVHPNKDTTRDTIENMAREYPGVRVRFLSDDLGALMAMSDAVLTSTSTTGFEALLLRRPLIVVKMSVTNCYFPFREISPYVYDAQTSGQIMEGFSKIEANRNDGAQKEPFINENQRILSLDESTNDKAFASVIGELEKVHRA